MPASKAQQAKTADRRARLVQLKLAGVDYESIARQLGYSSPADARKDLTRAFDATARRLDHDTQELRALELARLDRLQAALWSSALGGDVRAVEVSLKVIDRRCRLLGLDAPTRHEVITLDAIEAEITRLETELADDQRFGGVQAPAPALPQGTAAALA
jgi:hypothetical protein